MTEDMTQFLLNQFEIMADAPGGVQRLRELILQLAVTGRLGTGDEINQIFLGEGVEIVDFLSSFPNNWKLSSLESISSLITDGTHITPNYTFSGIPFLSVNNLSSGKISFQNCKYITELEHLTLIKRAKPEKSDLLLGKVGSIGVCDVIETDREFSIFVQLSLIKPLRSTVISYYLRCAILSPFIQTQIIHNSSGTALKYIGINKIKKLIVPLPPIAEQHRIVEKVDSLMALCDDLEAKQTQKHNYLVKLGTGSLTALQQSNTQEELAKWWGHVRENFGLIFDCVENVEALRQTVLFLAFRGILSSSWRNNHNSEKSAKSLIEELKSLNIRDKVKHKNETKIVLTELQTIPDCWEWVFSHDICQNISSGSTPSSDKMSSGYGDIPFIKVYNLTFTGLLNFSKNPTFVKQSTHENELKRSIVYPKDVLINIVGPPLGKVSIVPSSYPEWNINQAIVLFRPYEGIDIHYFKYALMSPEIQYRLISRAKATTTQHNISVTMCRNIPIPVAPNSEQKIIVKMIDHFMALCDQLEQSMDHRSNQAFSLSNATIQQIIGLT